MSLFIKPADSPSFPDWVPLQERDIWRTMGPFKIVVENIIQVAGPFLTYDEASLWRRKAYGLFRGGVGNMRIAKV